MKDNSQNHNFLFTLISKGLELWIRSKCESLKGIKVILEGPSEQLVKGEINTAIVKIKEVLLQDFFIKEAELCSDKIGVKLNILNPNNMISFKDSFTVHGNITLEENGLSHLIKSSKHSSIKKVISKLYKEQSVFKDLKINSKEIIITYYNEAIQKEEFRSLSIKSYEGKVIISDKNSSRELKIPNDPNIYIKEIKIENKKLILIGNAKVDP